MKTLNTITILLIIILVACNNPQKTEASAALDDLDNWMEELEDNAEAKTINSWQEIEQNYNAAKEKVDNNLAYLSEDSKEDYEELQEEFEEVRKEYKAAIDNTQIAANDKMTKIEKWMQDKQNAMENDGEEAAENVEEEWNEFKSDFKEGVDDLTDETKEKWNTLENRVDQWLEYELKIK